MLLIKDVIELMWNLILLLQQFLYRYLVVDIQNKLYLVYTYMDYICNHLTYFDLI